MKKQDPDKAKAIPETPPSKIIIQLIEEEMKSAYVDYAMSVIVGRALPDVRDGLKPVQRRILFAMNELGNTSSKAYKKCARIVGEVLGKYHPHGDTAVYDALVRMAQDFSLRYPLVQGQGNFGSIDGDNPAAMRYTEARLAKISDEMLEDIDKETVDFSPNFDETLKEPKVLPAKLPAILINGSAGIAVGMATNIPPHNISEVCSAIIHLIDHPGAGVMDLLEFVKGPDFPTGASIIGKRGLLDAYNSGRGLIQVRAKITEERKKDRIALIVSEVPYQVNKATLVEELAQLVRDKIVTEISDLRDESDRAGIRVVIELKKDANADVVKNQLYNHSKLQTSFSMIFIALVNNEPKTLGLKAIMQHYITYRAQVITRRVSYDLRKAQERSHILEGLLIALASIDAVVALIKKSKDADAAKLGLVSTFNLDEIQAQAILDMRLQRLAALEQQKIRDEEASLQKSIAEYQDILAHEEKVRTIIKVELEDLRQRFGDARRTIIEEGEVADDFIPEDLIPNEPCVITISESGYAKRISPDAYRVQRRGGKGVIGTGMKEEDVIEHLFYAKTHARILIFTSHGQVHWLKAYQIPEGERTSKGKAIVNMVQLEDKETVSAVIPVERFDDKHFLVMATKNGTVKKSDLLEYSRPRQGGIRAISLDEGDELVTAIITDGTKDIVLGTKSGLAVRFSEEDARSIGRTGRGVRGIRLEKDDEVVGMILANDQETLLTITENGYGKRTPFSEYRRIGRGGKGVINILTTERNGKVVALKRVSDNDELLIMSKLGQAIRTHARDLPVIGRNTQGVRIMKLDTGDHVRACAKLATNVTGVAGANGIAGNGSGNDTVTVQEKTDISPPSQK